MDIPNSGAVFTLGKSYLAENTQSYFYIKNDPVKRLISGPYQSAVICESGRLFVWGENRHGQLGIGASNNKNGSHANGSSSSNGNGNVTTSNSKIRNNVIDDVVTKPTCVKSLKTLGLKIADVAFGNDWAIILTHSNELFFSGRNIFHDNKKNFVASEVAGAECSIIRKPFRLEEFDNCLSTSEEEENFVSVLAGNEHFAVMTTSGRLIGWGSNAKHQQGGAKADHGPQEIVLDTAIQQFTCGPESTLVLTNSGKLYLTGTLQELVFPQFTELQKNLAPNEEIIFMHISKASEIYIVTNTGNIYRSFEAIRDKSLIFQRFYDYDSEENGPIWKLLRGSSFYTVLTRANKFYTTFSESGHHLKTFREISKFRNLRLIDMAVGTHHILVHGIPRSSTLSATVGPGGEHRYMSRTLVMSDANGNIRGHKFPTQQDILEEKSELDGDEVDMVGQNETQKANTQIQDAAAHMNEHVNTNESTQDEETSLLHKNNDSEDEEFLKAEKESEMETELDADTKSRLRTHITEDGKSITSKSSSPSESLKSRISLKTIKSNHGGSLDSTIRQHTPYADGSGPTTPQTPKKAMRNFSYEAAMEHDAIENTTPALHDSLEHIAEAVSDGKERNAFNRSIKTPTPPYEEDEELTVEIQTFTDELDRTVNQIRFINNGVDVTPKVADSISIESESRVTGELLTNAGKEVDKLAKETVDLWHGTEVKPATEGSAAGGNVREANINNVATADHDAKKSSMASFLNGQTMNQLSNETIQAVSDTTQSVGKSISTLASKTQQAADSVTSKLSNEMQIAQQKLSTVITSSEDSSNKVETDAQGTYGSGSSKNSKERILPTTAEDENTTASVSSTHTSSGNPFDSGNPFERNTNPFDNETNESSITIKENIQPNTEKTKGKIRQFFSDIRSKSKGISCRSEKDVRVEDDPPRYTPVEELVQRSASSAEINNSNTSKVCTIL